MPIGKNAIKRVTNNGYSNVKTTAPDMENSTEFPLKPKPMKKKATPATKKTAATKSEARSDAPSLPDTPKVTAPTEAKAAPAANQAETDASVSERCGLCYINIGGKLPTYLL